MAFSFTNTILAFLPVLRLTARKHCATTEEADELVARALIRAIERADGFSPETYVEPWLMSHLEAVIAARSDAVQH